MTTRQPMIPEDICEVRAEILKHPNYQNLGESTTWAFEQGCANGHPRCAKANDAWSRLIWTKLYVDWNTDIWEDIEM